MWYNHQIIEQLRSQLAYVRDELQVLTQQHHQATEGATEQLRSHSERNNRLVRAMHHQVHRMLATRRRSNRVKLALSSWKHYHDYLKQCKQRVRLCFVRNLAGAVLRQLGAAYRSWVIYTHYTATQTIQRKQTTSRETLVQFRCYFDNWRNYLTFQRVHMKVIGIMSFIARSAYIVFF